MRRLSFALAGSILLLISASPGSALRDLEFVGGPGRLELLLVEAEGCAYCQLLRQQVLPLYRTGTAARRVPIRFVDVSHIAYDSPLLTSPVTIVPTAVLLSDGREVARVTGYAGPEVVLRLVLQQAPPSD